MGSVEVTDHAVLRYLERAHGLDVDAVRRHLAERAVNAARLGAVAVTIENVKLVLIASRPDGCTTTVVTVLRPGWPALRDGGRAE